MRLIDEYNATEYLRERGWIGAREQARVERLAGGVSNEVLYVSREAGAGQDFVLKQARGQLRTPDPWFSSVERIWREVEVLRICRDCLDRAASATAAGLVAVTPAILHEDRDEYAFAMTAAPRTHRVWKAELLAGRADEMIAEACGELLGTLHAETWDDPGTRAALGDARLFDELRIDPYYRTLAVKFPTERPLIERLIHSLAQNRRSLVHADFSPKNLLLYDGGLMMVDFETGHFGDPAFDLGFFLTHLALKAVLHAPRHEPMLRLADAFWRRYRARMAVLPAAAVDPALEQRALAHLAGCVWARLDGKSQVEYLSSPVRRDVARGWGRRWLADWPAHWSLVRAEIDADLSALPVA